MKNKEIHIIRTNIVIDDKLMEDMLRATGLKTKREVVELGLRTLLRLREQEHESLGVRSCLLHFRHRQPARSKRSLPWEQARKKQDLTLQ